MDTSLLCRELEDLVEQTGIVIRYETFDDPDVYTQSGLCTVKGKKVLFVERNAPVERRIKVFAQCLNQADLQNIYIKPAVRDYLHAYK